MICVIYNGDDRPCLFWGEADQLSFVWRRRPTACVWIIPGTIKE